MNELFKIKGLKLTKQRETVISLINQLQDQATLKNIAVKCNNLVDTSTVYRIIDLFNEKGILDKQVNYNNEIYYSIKEEHGHYFTCIKCHKKEKLDICPLDQIDDEYEHKKGYKILRHQVCIEGICSDCQDKH